MLLDYQTSFVATSFLLLLLTSVPMSAQIHKETSLCHPQTDTLTKKEFYATPDKKPMPIGGFEKLVSHLSKNLVYPAKIRTGLIGSKVIVAFIVDSDGNLVGKRTIKNIPGTNLSNQLLDLLDDVPWQPGTCNGKKVDALLVFPVIVDIDE